MPDVEPTIVRLSKKKFDIENKIDAYLFFCSFLVGAVGIVFFKYIFVLSQLYVTLFPVSIMFAYLGGIIYRDRLRVREDVIGDNLYYLGFLFTLTSLSCALYSFSTGDNSTKDIISNFGIALATTIVGLALRVLLNQIRRDVDEIERDTRMALTDAATKLKADLQEMEIEFNSFRRTIQQSISEGFTDVSKKANDEISAATKLSMEMMVSLVDKANLVMSGFAENAGESNKLSGKTVRSMEKLVQKIDLIDVSPDLVEKKLEPIFMKMNEMLEKIHVRNDADEQIVKSLSQLVDTANTASKQIDERIISFSLQEEELSSLVKNVKVICDNLGILSSTYQQSAELSKELTENMDHYNAKFREMAESSLADFSGKLNLFMDSIRSNIGNSTNETYGHVQSMFKGLTATLVSDLTKYIQDTIKRSYDEILSHNSRMANELSRMPTSIKEMERNIYLVNKSVDDMVKKVETMKPMVR